MKAVQISAYGGNEVLEINNIQIPSFSGGQILIEVRAASLNPFDLKVRAGYLKEMAPISFPATLGGDFSGIVKETGEEVYGSAIIFGGGSGAFAEVLAANTKNSAQKPKSVNFIEAAALPLVGSSAIQALEEHLKLQSGQKILIHGGAGGIGHLSIQLAKALGAYVGTTVSQDDFEFVKGLGADEVIDYQSQDFENILEGFDAVFDTVGGETTEKSFKVLREGGILVSMLGEPNQELAQKYGVSAIGQNTKTNTEHLNRLAEFVDSGKIKVHVDKVFPLEKIKEAFQHLEEGHPRGKVVLQVRN